MSFDALAREYEATMARARARAATIGDALDELAGVRGRARSPGGEADAVVDGRGALVALRLAASVTRLDPEVVGALIVDTAQAAALDAAGRRRRMLDDLTLDLGR
jgi:YbaB/EbfC DNA-binding family